jgi:hypothetical protein
MSSHHPDWVPVKFQVKRVSSSYGAPCEGAIPYLIHETNPHRTIWMMEFKGWTPFFAFIKDVGGSVIIDAPEEGDAGLWVLTINDG